MKSRKLTYVRTGHGVESGQLCRSAMARREGVRKLDLIHIDDTTQLKADKVPATVDVLRQYKATLHPAHQNANYLSWI